VARTDAGTFEAQHDVTDPEHLPDRTRRPVLALAALDADQIDVEACVTTAGPNRPRLHQNFVFVLVPETVHVKGEVWREDRVIHAQEVQNRLEEVARDVLARRRLKDRPENYGITVARLAEKDFDTRLKERELALDTVVTQAYNAVWFPSAAGQVVRKEIKTAGGLRVKLSYVTYNNGFKPRVCPPYRVHSPQPVGDSFGVFVFAYTATWGELA
jgi:hypothetical protein